MRTLKISTTYNLVVLMVDASDQTTGKTGLTLTITASKDGSSFSSITPTVTELSSGFYKLALTTSHTDTAGDLALHITGSGADPADVIMVVRPNVLGDTLPANVLQYGSSNGTFSGGRPEVNTTHAGGTAWGSGAITAGVIATDAIGSDEVAASAVTKMQSGLSTLNAAGIRTAVGLATANLDTQLAGVTAPTVGQIADAVWEEAVADHTGVTGSTAEALNAAGAAGDPWITVLPGAYGPGSAGKIIGHNLDATVSSRSTYDGDDTSGTTTLLARLTDTRAGYLDQLVNGLTIKLRDLRVVIRQVLLSFSDRAT